MCSWPCPPSPAAPATHQAVSLEVGAPKEANSLGSSTNASVDALQNHINAQVIPHLHDKHYRSSSPAHSIRRCPCLLWHSLPSSLPTAEEAGPTDQILSECGCHKAAGAWQCRKRPTLQIFLSPWGKHNPDAHSTPSLHGLPVSFRHCKHV